MRLKVTCLSKHNPTMAIRFMLLALLLTFILAAIPFPMQGTSHGLPAVADELIRPCKGLDTQTQPKPKNPKKRKPNGDSSEQSPGVCVEVRTGILGVQEILQAKVRELRWTIRDETLNESSWLFLRDLNVTELLGMTKEDKRPGDVEWKSGSVTIRVTTTDAGEGFTRTIILAQFRGVGETADKLKMQHEWWPLESNGTLEESLMEAIRKHFAPPSE